MNGLFAQMDEAVDAVGRVTEFGVVGILLFIIVLIVFGVGITVRYVSRRLLDEEKGILTTAARAHIIAMDKLGTMPASVEANTQATRKVESHVVKIATAMDSNTRQIRNFRLIWKRYVKLLRQVPASAGKLAEAEPHLNYMENLLNDEGETST